MRGRFGKTRKLALAAIAAFSALPMAADNYRTPDVAYENIGYNGRFTFPRLRFEPSYWGPGNYAWGLDMKWNHDYPRADLHFMAILDELTLLDVNRSQTNVLRVGDPEIFQYPRAYICEAGFWTLDEAEAENLRNYLLKGGFLVVDDFFWDHWSNFDVQIHKVFPQAQLIELDPSHPIFDAFFHTEPLQYVNPYYPEIKPIYYGIFEDNDPAKRMMAIVNYNNDVGEYWEWSDIGWVPIELSNEAYKLGVNYVVYGMTH